MSAITLAIQLQRRGSGGAARSMSVMAMYQQLRYQGVQRTWTWSSKAYLLPTQCESHMNLGIHLYRFLIQTVGLIAPLRHSLHSGGDQCLRAGSRS